MANLVKRLGLALLVLLAPTFAPAMQQSTSPPKFNIPWSNGAVAPYIRNIPQGSQIGIQNCAASLTDGFPPLTFVPANAGGCPPFGADFNGILKQITQWSRWSQASAPVFYDAGFSTGIGGYPKGTILQSAVLQGRLWFSTADDNTTNPDSTTSANWTVLPGTNGPGTPVPAFTTTAPPNTVSANGLTVGNASSNATSRPNADTYWLFVFLWTNCPNTQCQLFNSSGGAIARGANANADFAANNAIATINMNGTGLIGADSQSGTTSAFLASVPIISGNTTTPGSIVGVNSQSIPVASIQSFTPTGNITNGGITITNGGITITNGHITTTSNLLGLASGGSGAASGANLTPNTQTITSTQAASTASQATTTASQTTSTFAGVPIGSGTPLNNVDRSIVTYWNLSL